MLNSLIVAYVQFMIMLIKLQKVLSHDLSAYVVSLPQFYHNEPYQNYACESLTFLLH